MVGRGFGSWNRSTKAGPSVRRGARPGSTREQSWLQYEAVVADSLLDVRTGLLRRAAGGAADCRAGGFGQTAQRATGDYDPPFRKRAWCRASMCCAQRFELASARPKLVRARNALPRRQEQSGHVARIQAFRPRSGEDVPMTLTGQNWSRSRTTSETADSPRSGAGAASGARVFRKRRPAEGTHHHREVLLQTDHQSIRRLRRRANSSFRMTFTARWQDQWRRGVQLGHLRRRLPGASDRGRGALREGPGRARRWDASRGTGSPHRLFQLSQAREVLETQKKVSGNRPRSLAPATARYEAAPHTARCAQRTNGPDRSAHDPGPAMRDYLVAAPAIKRAMGRNRCGSTAQARNQ